MEIVSSQQLERKENDDKEGGMLKNAQKHIVALQGGKLCDKQIIYD